MVVDHLLGELLDLRAAGLFQGKLAALDFQVAGFRVFGQKAAVFAVQFGDRGGRVRSAWGGRGLGEGVAWRAQGTGNAKG
ncbi:hypothetical protein D3C78_1878450 [compost metagenome]